MVDQLLTLCLVRFVCYFFRENRDKKNNASIITLVVASISIYLPKEKQ